MSTDTVVLWYAAGLVTVGRSGENTSVTHARAMFVVVAGDIKHRR